MADAYKFSQLMKDNLGNTFKYLGNNDNSAVLVACAIALFKGIFRPAFTMMDKKSDPETKKFAAIREALTELVALPIYAVTPLIIEKGIINKLCNGKEGKALKAIKSNAKFTSVCLSTLLIPAICNVIQPPTMNFLQKRNEAKKRKLDINTNPEVTQNKVANPLGFKEPTLNAGTTKLIPTRVQTNSGMKVGG